MVISFFNGFPSMVEVIPMITTLKSFKAHDTDFITNQSFTNHLLKNKCC